MSDLITKASQVPRVGGAIDNFAAPIPESTYNYWEVKDLLERSGYTVARDGTAVRTASIVDNGINVSGQAVTDLAVTGSGDSAILTSTPLNEYVVELGPKVTSGGVYAFIDAIPYIAAVAQGTKIGIESYKSNPEFWTDFSNAIFGNPTNPTDLHLTPTNLLFGAEVILRKVEGGEYDGQIISFGEVETIHKAYNEFKKRHAYDPGNTITPTHDYSGTYDLEFTGHYKESMTPDELLDIVQTITRFPMTDSQRAYLSDSLPEVIEGLKGLTVFYMDRGTYHLYGFRMWFAEDAESRYVVKDGTGRYVSTATVVRAYDPKSESGAAIQTEDISRYLNGYNLMDKVIYSDVDCTTIEVPTVFIRPDGFEGFSDDDFNDWVDNNPYAFEVGKLNDDGTITRKKYIPLGLDNVTPDDTINPDESDKPHSREGNYPDPSPTPDPDYIPDYIGDSTVPPITYPGFNNPVPETSEGNPPSIVPPVSSMSNKLYTVYHPSDAILDSLGGVLWNNSITEQIVKMFTNNPMDAIISLHEIYCTPRNAATKHIMLGSYNSNISCPTVKDRYKTIDCGSIYIPEIYGDARDYIRTQAEIYLPFISFRSVDVRDIVNCIVNVVYTIDLYTGSCLAVINTTKDGVKQTLYTFEGNCGAQIPLTAAQRNGLVSLISATASSLIGGVTGGVGGAVAMGVGKAVAGVGSGAFQANISRTSGFSGNAGAMAIKTPYIIITRNKSADAANYEHYIGKPTNRTVYLTNCSGYTRVKAVHVENIPGATDKEKDMIKALLEGGVIL